MPSLSSIRDYILPVGASIAGGLINRRAASNATNRLTNGANTAMGTIQGGADRASALINTGATNARRTLADVYAEQNKRLDPYRVAGEGSLGTLTDGVKPGGDFVKPFNAETFKLYEDPGFQFRVKQGNRAIEAGANAGGIRFSGATLKALSNYNQEAASQEYGAARDRAVDDQSRAYDRTRDMVDLGYNAASKQVDAGGTYGANLSNLETGTSRSLADLQTGTASQLADLQTDLASAEAMGDTAKANSLTTMINGILSGVDNVGTARSLAALLPGGAAKLGTTAGALSGLGLSGGAAAAAASTAGLGTTAGAVSGLGLGGGTAAGGGAAAGGGGAMGAMGAFLTNPITIAAGLALGVGILWKKSQVHPTASKWVNSAQNDFDKQMAQVNEDASLDPANKAELQKAIVTDYLAGAMTFMGKGKENQTVIRQAMDTFRQWYPRYASMAVA